MRDNPPPRRRCPVCLRRVRATKPYLKIESHWDSIGREVCPGAGEPFYITLPERVSRHVENVRAWQQGRESVA